MSVGRYDYQIKRGQVLREQFNFYLDGKPVSIDDYLIQAEIRSGGNRVVVFDEEDGSLSTVPGREGSFQLVLSAERTQRLPVGRFRHKLQVTPKVLSGREDPRAIPLLEGEVEIKE